MNVILLEDEAFYQLVKTVVERIKKESTVAGLSEDWINKKEAMELLNIKASCLQKLRDTGKIEYSQPSRKVILYKKSSINNYLENHIKEKFK